jgi:ATP-dependent RNA helicase DeaD
MTDVEVPLNEATAFKQLGLNDRLLETLVTLGYEEPTPIQRATIPPLLAGRDVIGQAATGTGKTAAFALPLLQRIASLPGHGRPSALILVPTRELAMQVAGAVHRYGRLLGTTVLPIYGGQAYGPQLRGLERGVDLIVATPGRALDHMKRGTLRLEHLQIVVLDEADEMLDMGFAEDIETLLRATPRERQTLLFSATIPPRISAIARRHLRDPLTIQVGRERTGTDKVSRVRQVAYIVSRMHKLATLGRVLDVENPTSALIFCRMRTEVDELAEALNARGYDTEALHGGMSQEQRDRVMRKFRSTAVDLLIATDVAARGLDIAQLSHVVNYDVPSEPESYIHRIGRVGRAGREGVAITLAEPREYRQLRNIEQATKQKIKIERIPSVADLQARRLELTREAIREAITGGELEHFQVVVESLATEFDIMEIALAAVKLACKGSMNDLEQELEIPEVPIVDKLPGSRRSLRTVHKNNEDRANTRSRSGSALESQVQGPPTKRQRNRPDKNEPSTERHQRRNQAVPMTQLRISAGRIAGIRPQDLVGAIAGEAEIPGRNIGAIEIADHYSLVDVPENVVDQILTTFKTSKLKGKKVRVRRANEPGGG